MVGQAGVSLNGLLWCEVSVAPNILAHLLLVVPCNRRTSPSIDVRALLYAWPACKGQPAPRPYMPTFRMPLLTFPADVRLFLLHHVAGLTKVLDSLQHLHCSLASMFGHSSQAEDRKDPTLLKVTALTGVLR